MNNKYYIAIAKEKYDCYYQEMEYLGLYDCFYTAVEQVKQHNESNYMRGCREFEYFIFVSYINDKIVMKEENCIYSLTSKMLKDHVEYIHEEYTKDVVK